MKERIDVNETHLSRVVHVIPYDQARGAQRYAEALVSELGSDLEEHLLLTIFSAGSGVLEPDLKLEVPLGAWRRLGLDARAVTRMRRALRRLSPQVVVAHGGEAAKYAALSMPRDLPFVYVNIGTVHPGLDRSLSSAFYHWYVGRADLVVAVSTAVADQAVRLHRVPAERVIVIPNGRDDSVFVPSEGEEDREGIRLIWIGQLDSTKRPEWFIRVIAALNDDHHRVEGWLVGDGPRREEIRQLAKTAGAELLGRRDDVALLLAQSDALVFTGTPPEGMPGVLIEAGMCGLPVVATKVPGAADIVEAGVTGVLVDVDDLDGMIEAVGRLVGDSRLRTAMGASARKRCVERFSMEATVGLWRDALRRVQLKAGLE